MVLKQTAESARRSHEKGEEDSEYGDWWPGKSYSVVPKQDSMECPASSSAHKDHLHERNPPSQNPTASAEYNYQLSTSASPGNNNAKASAIAISIPAHMSLDYRSIQVLRSASPYPPINTTTLSELDLDRIMGNINLRVDVNFDRDLFFRPIEGKKGHERDRLARVYWEAIAMEISIYVYHAATASRDFGSTGYEGNDLQPFFEPRLPLLLETLKEVLWTLVPERDHQSIADNLDVPFIMQQIEKGVLNLVNLLRWLSGLVKSHCAPMRDILADQMVNEIQQGLESHDIGKTAQGLRTMFGMLESMKLDVANHQIRTFRLFLVEDTVRFLQIYYRQQLTQGAICPERGRKWFHNALRAEEISSDQSLSTWGEIDNIATIFRGLSWYLFAEDNMGGCPATFEYNHNRLWMFKSDVQDLIALELCSHVFDFAARGIRNYVRTRDGDLNLRSRIWSIVEDEENEYELRWYHNIGSLALEIARIVSNLESASRGIPASGVPDEAVLSFVEQLLESCLNPCSQQYKHFADIVHQQLEEATLPVIERYLDMSLLQMCDDQYTAPGEAVHQQRPRGIDIVGKKLAHLCVLHWRIWGPILYLPDSFPSSTS